MLNVLLLILVSGSANAQWAFKAFRGEKVHLQKSIAAYDSVLLMVDQACLDEQKRMDKHHRDPLTEMGFEVQHNNSTSMRIRAISARAVRADAAANLNANECVVGATENPEIDVTAADPLISKQHALVNFGMEEADRFFNHPIWGVRRTVDVGVVDTGIEFAHPELLSRLWRGPNGESGWDFVNDDADPSDDSGHGTHVAGIIGAQTGNGIGIRGMANVRLMPVKSQDSQGNGNMADVVNAIRWAIDHGAEILNLSLASRMQNPALEDAVQYGLALNVVQVVASGNDGEEITASNFMAPISYSKDYLGLIGVGSVDALTNAKSSFSNFSSTYVEMAAPGSAGAEGIFSTFVGGGYRGMSGTSMAAPQVTGAAALVMGFLKTHSIPYTPAQIELLIQNSALKDSSLSNSFTSGRRLQMERLGRMLFNSTVVDSTGGFDEP
jgi:hypothetical protein